jgi:hypothetical protein
MNVRFHHSLAVAQAVLALLTDKLSGHDDSSETRLRSDATIEAYQNGREHGFTVTAYFFPDEGGLSRRAVTFAEYRNSDQIVVYPDNFTFQGLDEKPYQDAEYFRFDAHYEAAHACFCWLTKGDWS